MVADDPSSGTGPALPGAVVPRRHTLDGFAEEVARTDGIALGTLDPITTLRVRTNNSLYEITVVDPRQTAVIVQGGRFFREPTRACLSGSSFGGTCLKLAWVGIGMRMEFHFEHGWVLTSRVRSIAVQPSVPGPF